MIQRSQLSSECNLLGVQEKKSKQKQCLTHIYIKRNICVSVECVLEVKENV